MKLWILAIVFVVASIGCASTPWACTPSGCVSVASAPLPEQVRGDWVASDGATLRIVDYYTGNMCDRDSMRVVSNAASAWIRRSDEDVHELHITSFDGIAVVGEEYIGGLGVRADRSPRRFCRLRAGDDWISVETLNLDILAAEYDGDDLQIIDFEGQDAAVYTDIRGLADTMRLLLDRDDAWTNKHVFGKDLG